MNKGIFSLAMAMAAATGILLLVEVLFWGGTKKEGMDASAAATPPPHVPLKIHQTWKTKSLQPKMDLCVKKLKRDNPEFQHTLYDDTECREYIKNNYTADVLNAFDRLVPGAYKADLFRYCILYKEGGIYLDIKFQCENGFRLMEATDKDYFCLDRPHDNKGVPFPLKDELAMVSSPDYSQNIFDNMEYSLWRNGRIGIYNAFIACKPNHPVLMDCINQIVRHVNIKFYGDNPLDVTGPGLLGAMFFKNDYSKIGGFEYFNCINGNYIISKKKMVLSQYRDYRTEQMQDLEKHHNKYYDQLWKERGIYADAAESNRPTD